MLAPKDYPQRIELMKAAQRDGIDQDQIADFLWLANARPDLKHLSVVVNNLLAALELARRHWPSILVEERIDWLPGLLAQLSELLKTTSLPTGAESVAMDGGESQIEGRFDWLVRNAFYAAMGFSRKKGDDALRERYRLLQAHFALAHFHVTRTNRETTRQLYEEYGESSEWSAIKISPKNVGLAVRNLTENALWANDILYRMQLDRRPREFAADVPVRIRFFKKFKRKPSPASVARERKKKNAEPNGNVEKPESIQILDESWTENRVTSIYNYLSQAYGIKSRRQGGGGAPRIYIYSMGDPDDPAYDLGDLTSLDDEAGTAGAEGQTGQPGQSGLGGQQQAGEQSKEDEQLAADECPGEDDGQEDTLGWTPGDETTFQRSPGSFGGCLRTVTHHLIRETKSFAFGYERLAAYELRCLHPWDDFFNGHLINLSRLPGKEWSDLKNRKFYLQYFHVPQSPNPIDFELAVETRLLLVTMLWTGSTVERATSVIWNKQLSATPCGDMEIAGGVNGREPGAIRLKVPFPSYRQVQDPVPGLDCERKQYLVLPDPGNLSLAYSWWMEWRKKRYNSTTAFGRERGEYREPIARLLQVFDPTGRLTLSKIAGTLYGQIMARTGNDAVAAAMITGQVRRGARVPMFYACRAERELQRIYTESVHSLSQEIHR